MKVKEKSEKAGLKLIIQKTEIMASGLITFHGNIISLIYIGDHYEIMVRTEEEEDFILNTPDLWNENDEVSVIIDQSKINLSRKGAKK